MATLAVSGASGKTGWRVAQEAMQRGWQVRALVRPGSVLPQGLEGAEIIRLDLQQREALHQALAGCDALVIATGARPSVDLTGPLRIDALGVRAQLAAAKAVGLERVVLVSSLCAGRWSHPLNLFGLILVWKRLGERWLERSGLRWTIVRPGGLSEREDEVDREGLRLSGADQQQSRSIPRRLVARLCLEALADPASEGRILEVTSDPSLPPISLSDWLAAT